MSLATQKLVTSAGVLMTDAEDLLKASASQAGDKIAELRGRIQQTVADLKPRLQQAQATLKDTANAAVVTTDDYVHAKPWHAIGVAAGVGLLIGLLVSRR